MRDYVLNQAEGQFYGSLFGNLRRYIHNWTIICFAISASPAVRWRAFWTYPSSTTPWSSSIVG